jgi:predicted small secreted protein
MNSYTVKNYMWAVIIFMFIMIALLSGCSTVEGVGKDIQNASQWTHDKMSGDSK